MACFMMPMVISVIYVCKKILGLRCGRLQRHKIETTMVGYAVKDLLQLEWLAPYGLVEPGSSTLLEKSWSDWWIRQLTCLLWAASAPKKEGRRAQQGQRSRPRNLLYVEVELSLHLDNHFLTWLHFWQMMVIFHGSGVTIHFRADQSTIKVACSGKFCRVGTLGGSGYRWYASHTMQQRLEEDLDWVV